MTHPLISPILELAAPVAASLGLDVVGAVFHTNQQPPVLRVDIRNPADDTGLEDCERMSHALSDALEAANLIPDAYILEVSSPGVSKFLTTDREFVSFKGFPVEVTTTQPHAGASKWIGQLVRRDDESIHLNRKGRTIRIPRPLVHTVQLIEGDASN